MQFTQFADGYDRKEVLRERALASYGGDRRRLLRLSGNKYDLYYPTPLGANGFKHPILTWGNGTFGQSTNYAYFLKHMASWGVVIHKKGRPSCLHA